MENERSCDLYPDVWQPVPDKHDPAFDQTIAQNRVHGRIYRAARYILVKDFNASRELPERPEDFPGNPGKLKEEQIAQLAAVHGMLVADGWDPSMGKTRPASDDLVLQVDGETMVIDRRFADAVVKGVQEYAAHAALFQRCHEYLREEGLQGDGHHPRHDGHAPEPAAAR